MAALTLNRDKWKRTEGEARTRGLDALAGAARSAGKRGPPPVHLWNPPYCGDIDMRIATDGTWFYQKTPIGRMPLVKLFASVLKVEDGKHFLVTPVEKCGIAVDDAPFRRRRDAGRRRRRGARRCISAPMSTISSPAGRPCAALRAGGGDRRAQTLSACAARPVGESARGRCSTIWSSSARSARSTASRMFGVVSGGEFFAMAPADTLKEFA